MTRRDEGQLLLASSSVGVPLNHVGTDISKQRQILTGKGLILTLFIALGIFGVSTGAARYLFPRASQSRLPVDQQTGFTVRYNPLEDDRSPTTAICTGDVSKPVLDGADFVAYFSLDPDSAGVYGTEDYVATYNGYSFWFISEENKALFEQEPLNYIPAWGGFCSWGISREDWWTAETLGPDTDPNYWVITDDGVLHFFRSALPKKKFMGKVPGVWGDIPGNIRAGNDRWISWWGKAEPGTYRGPFNTACFCSADTCLDA
ncbi:unnamed protein product [Ascophyllum nodosum]